MSDYAPKHISKVFTGDRSEGCFPIDLYKTRFSLHNDTISDKALSNSRSTQDTSL